MISLLIFLLLIIVFGYLAFYSPEIHSNPNKSKIHEKASLLIAYRNEQDNLKKLISALENQKYINKSHIQILLIDDHSTDSSPEILQLWQSKSSFQIKLISLTDEFGKKTALKSALRYSYYENLLFTDADCVPHSEWICQMLFQLKTKSADLLIGSVWYTSNNSIFQKLQKLEFSVLQACTALSVTSKYPFMCNGANLATKRSTYSSYLDSGLGSEAVSGDDVFFLDYLIENNQKITYANHQSAIVYTRPSISLKAFINQRKRWSAKMKYYKNIKMIIPSLFFTFWSFLSIVITVLFLCFKSPFILVLLLCKFCIDYALVWWFHKNFKEQFSIFTFILLNLIFPFYVFCVGVLSMLKPFTWKNRQASA